jgi:hypothetical protein
MLKLLLISVVSAAGIVTLASSPGQAQYAPWCSQRTDESRAQNCGFYTREQCVATMSGIGGYCYENYALPPSAQGRAHTRSRRYHRY